jgi:Domain of unknown function (DUF4349)
MTAQSVRLKAGLGAGLALTVLAGVSGCTSASKSASAAPAAVTEAAGAPVTMAAAAATTGAAPTMGAAPSAAAAATAAAAAPTTSANNGVLEGRPAFQADPTAGHSIIYTATLNLQVPKAADVATKADAAASAAYGAGGYVFARDGQAAVTDDDNPPAPTPSTSPTASDVATADITIKVPPAQFGDLLGTLESLGHVLNVEQHSQDVTDKVVDTSARLKAQQASVDRMRTLLQKANTIGQVVEVEGQLTSREADLESMEGELNVLKSQTAMATITVHMSSLPPKEVIPPKPVAKPKHHIHGFVGGLAAGGRGFATVAIGIATVFGALLPFLGVLLVLALLGWWARRSWLKNHRQNGPVEQATT